MTSPNTPVDVEAMELAERLLAKPAGVSAYGCQNCDEYLKQDAASALSRLLAERREMLEALEKLTDQVEAEFTLDGKWVNDGQLVTQRAYTRARAAILSALPEAKGE